MRLLIFVLLLFVSCSYQQVCVPIHVCLNETRYKIIKTDTLNNEMNPIPIKRITYEGK